MSLSYADQVLTSYCHANDYVCSKSVDEPAQQSPIRIQMIPQTYMQRMLETKLKLTAPLFPFSLKRFKIC